MARRSNNPFDRYRSIAWDEVADANNGVIPDLETVAELLVTKVGAVEIKTLTLMAARLAVKAEDSVRTSGRSAQLQLMFPGWPAPPDQFWKTGGGRRVRIRSASSGDHLAHIQEVEENAREVEDSRRVEVDHYQRLAPYYARGILLTEQAVEAYLEDHPLSKTDP